MFKEYIWKKCKGKLKPMKIKVSDIYSGYPELEIFEIEEINEFIQKKCSESLISATFDPKKNIYKTISISKEQLRNLFPEKTFDADFDEVITDVLEEHDAMDIKKYITENCFDFTSTETLRNELENFLNACSEIGDLQEDTFIRNLSIKHNLGSKGLESKTTLILRIFLPEELTEVQNLPMAVREARKSNLLQKLHLIRAYQYVLVKGEAVLKYSDYELKLNGYKNDAIQLSLGQIHKIKDIQCEKLLTIENLTTFNDFPFPFRGLIVYTGGYMDETTETFLKKVNSPAYHSGDLDAYGFQILHNMEAKLNRKIIPFMMDLQTYKKYSNYAIDITQDNISMMKAHMDDSDTEKELFPVLIAEGKILEQESFSCTAET